MQNRLFQNDTIAAVATPLGEGGIAIIRLSGPAALTVADRCFDTHSGQRLLTTGGYTVHYGRIVDSHGQTIDDGLATVFRAPRSFTGEESVEISCHGGRNNTGHVLRRTLEAGARLAEPGEFTRRAFINGKIDLAQAEAVADLIRAGSETARRAASRQLQGELSQRLAQIKGELIGILAAIEVTIDFSEEVGDLDYLPLLQRIQKVLVQIETLLATAGEGRILREGLHVAIVGRPNVGKSSLLNALLRADRAIVTPVAGTTRDLLEENATLCGLPFVLVDTAGIRETADPVEKIGVERARGAALTADLVLLVLEAGQSDPSLERELLNLGPMKFTVPILATLNKCDLLSENAEGLCIDKSSPVPAELERIKQCHPELREIVPISARTGAGLPELQNALLAAVGVSPQLEAAGSVVIVSERHREALSEAQRSLIEAVKTTAARLPGDFIAIDLRGALDAVGSITGETTSDEVIHRIFHDFCVGK